MSFSIEVVEDRHHDCFHGDSCAEGYTIYFGSHTIDRVPYAHWCENISYDEWQFFKDMEVLVVEAYGREIWDRVFSQVSSSETFDLETSAVSVRDALVEVGIGCMVSLPSPYSHYEDSRCSSCCDSCDLGESIEEEGEE